MGFQFLNSFFKENSNLNGESVFLRLDLNTPIKSGIIQDETRIEKSLPTLVALKEKGLKIVIASHLGRPKAKGYEKDYSLEPVGVALSRLLKCEILLFETLECEDLQQILKKIKENQIILLENLRFFKEELSNDYSYANKFSKIFGYYVNDAFAVSHRAHMSVCALPSFFEKRKRAAGYLIESEVKELTKVLNSRVSPVTALLGGAKVSDKIAVIKSLILSVNSILIGGAMAYTFLRARGFKTGASKIEKDKLSIVNEIYRLAEERNVKILLPVDHICAKKISPDSDIIATQEENIPEGYMGLDIGPKTRVLYRNILLSSKLIIWNGPLGVFELDCFSHGTKAMCKALSDTHAETIVGGGDSIAALNKFGFTKNITHISTGGGASLEFLEGKKLPGLINLYS